MKVFWIYSAKVVIDLRAVPSFEYLPLTRMKIPHLFLELR